MFISDVSIQRPVFTTMVIVGLMTLGILAFGKLGVALFPDVSFPVVTVTTVHPGASPVEVEQLVTREIEEAVSSVNGVTRVRSFSRDSASFVVIEFTLETESQDAAADVRERVASIRSILPDGIHEPRVERLDFSAQPIVTYVVGSPRGPADARRLADEIVKPRFEAVEGVGAVRVIGGLEREIRVQVDRHRLDALGLTLAAVAQQLGSEGVEIPAGRVQDGPVELNVKSGARYRSLDELRNMALAALPDGSQIRLSDVATVVDDYKEVRNLARLDGESAVALQVQKQGGTNTVAIADSIEATVAALKRSLPPDVSVIKAVDGSTFIRHNVADVTEAILFGGAMAVLVIFLFMLDWRSTVISALAIPTSVVTTFLVMWWLDFSFNIMSLLALSLSIGLLVDDAVVVRENIFRHMERGKDPVRAARDGTHEIGLAVMATTFTIVAVFVPVAFMGGIVGRMFKEFGITVAAAVLVSLFISFTLDPMMSAQVMRPLLPGDEERKRAHPIAGPLLRFYDRLDDGYRSLLRWALGHRVLVVALSAVLFLGSLGLTSVMGTEFLPVTDRGEFMVDIELPAGASVHETERRVKEAESIIREHPHIRSIYSRVGLGEETHRASLRVYATPYTERKPLRQSEIQDDLRERLSRMPDARFSVVDLGIVEGPANEVPIALQVRGPDLEVLEALAAQAYQVLLATPGVKDPDPGFRPGKPEASFRVNRHLAADLGVSTGTVAQTLRLAVEGAVVTQLQDGDRDVDVRVQLSPEQRASLSDLSGLGVPVSRPRPQANAMVAMAGFGGMPPAPVPVSAVTTLEQGRGPALIERLDRNRQVTLSAQISQRALGDIVADLRAALAEIELPEGYSFEFGGQTETMEETFDNMLLALLVAILFIYFVLASQFESLIHPLTIMMALPLAIVGALLGLFVTGWSIGMVAMIGVILLMGLVTKNAILLVEYTNELRARGLEMFDAVLEAGHTRLRPILMTSISTVLGMMPIALAQGAGAEFRAPMAIAVIGGVIVSTMLTLLVVPVVYTWMDRLDFTRHRRRSVVGPRVVEDGNVATNGEAE